MGDFVFITFMLFFIFSLSFAIKHYFFDMPRKDRLIYELDAIRDDLNYLVEQKIISTSSSEFTLLDTLLFNEYYFIKNGIGFKFVMKILSKKISEATYKKTEQTFRRIEQSAECESIHDHLVGFMYVNIIPSIILKAEVIYIFFRIVKFLIKPFQHSKHLTSTHYYQNGKNVFYSFEDKSAKGFKKTEGERISKELVLTKIVL